MFIESIIWQPVSFCREYISCIKGLVIIFVLFYIRRIHQYLGYFHQFIALCGCVMIITILPVWHLRLYIFLHYEPWYLSLWTSSTNISKAMTNKQRRKWTSLHSIFVYLKIWRKCIVGHVLSCLYNPDLKLFSTIYFVQYCK